MKFSMKDLAQAIVTANVPEETKVGLLERIMSKGTVTDGLYLKKDGQGMLECWYRNVDENGVTDHGPTNYTPEQIIEEYAQSLGRGLK